MPESNQTSMAHSGYIVGIHFISFIEKIYIIDSSKLTCNNEHHMFCDINAPFLIQMKNKFTKHFWSGIYNLVPIIVDGWLRMGLLPP